MSFSSDVKNELGKQFSKSRHCQIAELSAILMMEGIFDGETGGIIIKSDNPVILQKYALLLKQVFSFNPGKKLDWEDSRRILETMHWLETDLGNSKTDGMLLQSTCCKRAFLRGAFLSSGSISDPNKSYHFEIVCRRLDQANQIKDTMESFEIEGKIVERKGHFVVYVKEGSQIVDMLNVMEAYVSLMNLENVRILKEMRNSVNRKVNCETANISKTVNAAVKQIEDITKIRDSVGLDSLPVQLREIAYVRLDYPDAPLKEIGELLDPPVGKSGVNHRFRKIAAFADSLG